METENDEDSDIEVVANKNKVFQKEDPSLAVTLKDIMKKLETMTEWQKDHQKQTCNQGNQNSSQKNWRQSSEREMVSMTQEQKARWESQDRAMSQRDH